ncbi:hypothetical protein AALB16_02975 [Lachnospiraceae bacterium 62-35]
MHAFEMGEIVDDQLWYFSLSVNALIGVDMKSGAQIFIGSVPGEKLYGYRLYGSMQIIGDRMVLVPFSASSIAIFNISSKTFECTIPVRHPGKNAVHYREDCKFQSSAKYGNKVYMFGLTYPELLIYDCCDKELIYSRKWIDVYKAEYGFDICQVKDHFMFEKYNCLIDNRLYIPMGFTNRIMIMNMNDGDMEFLDIGKSGNIYYNIAYFNNSLWLACKEGDSIFLSYNLISQNQEEYTCDLISGTYKPCELIPLQNEIMAVPIRDIKPLMIDQDGSMKESKIPGKKSYIFFYKTYEEGLAVYSNIDKKISIFDRELNLVKEIDNDGQMDEIIAHAVRLAQTEQGYLVENPDVTLNEYLKSIVDRNKLPDIKNHSQSMGERIYCRLMDRH